MHATRVRAGEKDGGTDVGRPRILGGLLGLALIIAITATGGAPASASHTLAVGLGTAAPFAILAGTPNITDVPTSTIRGNVGLSPATGAGIGLTCAEVTGTIYSVDAAGPLPCRVTDPGLLGLAQGALTTAIGDAAGRLGGLPVAANELAGKTLTHGVYKSAAAMTFANNGVLTLDGGGDPNAVFIFQLGTVLTVGNATTVSLVNLAQSCNIFWQVDSATIGTTATFRGTILAATAITVANGSTIDGRLLAGTANVTLISDTITVPTCAVAPAPAPAPISGPTPTPTPVPTAGPITPVRTPAPAATATPSATPTPRVVAVLPSTSTGDGDGIAGWGFVLALAALGLVALVTVRTRRPAATPRL